MGKKIRAGAERHRMDWLVRGRECTRLFSAVLCLTGGMSAVHAQTAAPPAASASEAQLSEAVKRQAASPYRWILTNQTSAQKPRAPTTAPSPAPAPTAAAPAPVPAPAPTVASAPPAGANSAAAVAAAAARRAEIAEAAAKQASAAAATPAPAAVAAVAPPPPPPAPAPVVAAPPPPPPAPVQVAVAPPPPPPPKLNIDLVPISQPEPRLSPAAQRELASGAAVRIAFTVNTDGSTSDVRVVSSSTRALNNPVMAAVREWKYNKVDAPQKTEIELVFKQE